MKQRKENVSRILEDEGKCMADKTKVFSKRDKNVDYMNQMLPVEDSFVSFKGIYRLEEKTLHFTL